MCTRCRRIGFGAGCYEQADGKMGLFLVPAASRGTGCSSALFGGTLRWRDGSGAVGSKDMDWGMGPSSGAGDDTPDSAQSVVTRCYPGR